MAPPTLPDEVAAVLSGFRCCEVATIAADGTPVTRPMVPLWRPELDVYILTAAVGFAAKAIDTARDPRVSLLFSDPTGSGVRHPPTTLAQGRATVSDVQTWRDDLGAHWRRVFAVQRSSRFSSTPAARWLTDWYYLRLVIRVRPSRFPWWPEGDRSARPERAVLDGG